MKLEGVKSVSNVAQYLLDIKKASKQAEIRFDDDEGFLQTDDEEHKEQFDYERMETNNSNYAGKKQPEKIQVLIPEPYHAPSTGHPVKKLTVHDSSGIELSNRYLGNTKTGPGKGSSIVPNTPDDQGDSSNSSHSGFDDDEGFLQIDDEEHKEQFDYERMETNNSNYAGKKQPEKIQVLIPEP
nr:hypothetical protein [Tanacetum cinerariifolium]